MISKPLFIMVAESMVILLPIFQFGWFSACSTVTYSKASLVWFLNGPPDAVKVICFMCLVCVGSRAWKMALCSESTGIIVVP